MSVSLDGASYNVNVAELIQPEIVCRSSRKHKIPISQMGIDLSRGGIQLV